MVRVLTQHNTIIIGKTVYQFDKIIYFKKGNGMIDSRMRTWYPYEIMWEDTNGVESKINSTDTDVEVV